MKGIKTLIHASVLATLAIGTVMFAPSVTWAAPGDGFIGSPHDGTLHSTTKGACTNCHTPHKAKTTSLLWNHTLSTNTFAWDDTSTTAGTNYPTFKGDTYKGMSAKCLSCHDGSVAVTDGQWFMEGTLVTGTFKISDPIFQVGAGGSMAGSHPVAMPYPANGALSTYNGVTNGSTTALGEWVPDPMATNNIRLYNDNGAGVIKAGTVTGKTGIECGSCHDIHNGSSVKDDLLVRGTIAGSSSSAGGYICLQCHKK